MTAPPPPEFIHTRIWDERAETDNPFAAALCLCHGYDVYGDLLGQAGWADYIYLLFRGEAPTSGQARLLEDLAVALANPGPRDASVHAAMAGGIGGSTSAACLTAALAVGAGGLGGARETHRCMGRFTAWGRELETWRDRLREGASDVADIWPAPEHPPGFDPHGVSCPTPVRQTLGHLARISPGPWLPWLDARRTELEALAGLPLAMPAIAAAALMDLGFAPDEGEMLVLLLRLPGAAAHALEQRRNNYRSFPFFRIELENGPAPHPETRKARP